MIISGTKQIPDNTTKKCKETDDAMFLVNSTSAVVKQLRNTFSDS